MPGNVISMLKEFQKDYGQEGWDYCVGINVENILIFCNVLIKKF